MMSLFYKQFIESVLSFCIVAWYGNLSLSNKNRLGGLVKVAGKIIGVRLIKLGLLKFFKILLLRKPRLFSVLLTTTTY